MLMLNRKLSPNVVITSVKNNLKENSNHNPAEFGMLQNYPNPFNPSTKIKFSIPYFVETQYAASLRKVTLKIFDVLGRELKTLISEEMKPGEYEVAFDGNNLASGIYYCYLRAGEYSQSIKMVFLK